MALAGELARYIGNEMIGGAGKELATKASTSALSSIIPSAVSKAGTGLATKATLGNIIPKATAKIAPDSMMTLYRGLTQKYDPKFPVGKLDTAGYESWTDNPELAKQYGDYVYSIDVPKADIKDSYLDENPSSPTYGDRNPIYGIDKKAGLNGVKGKEYLLEVGSDYQKGLKYNLVEPENEMSRAVQKSGVGSDVAKRADGYLGGRMLDKSGKPVTFYHSTPNEFSKFDDARLGENTGYDNTALGHFVTTDKDFSKRFIDINDKGLKGRTMELQANVNNPIIHPYMAGYKYEDPAIRDKIVENYFLATGNQDALDTLRDMVDEDAVEFGGDANLYNEYMALADDPGGGGPFEFAGDERELLKKKGYDAVEIVEGPKSGLVEGSKDNSPISSYAVFSGENLRPVRHIPVQQDNSVPVSVKKYLPKLSPMSDDDASMLMENYSSNKANKLNGTDTSADELVVRNIAKKNGISKKTMDLMKKYSDLTDNDTYNKAKTALNKLLTRDNKEIDALDKMSRELLRTMGIEYENDMPVVYRATTANENGSLSYTTDKKIAEKLLKNDDSYKKVIRYIVKPNDIVIAPQFLGPLDTGADLAHIIVKKA